LASSTISEKSDIEEAKVQKAALREDLKSQGYDDEYISEHIDVLEEKGKLEEVSKKSFEKIIEKKKEYAKQKQKDIEKANKLRKEKSKKFKEGIQSFVKDNKEVGELTLTKTDQRDLPSYISDPTVELNDGRKVSQLQADVLKAMGDQKSLVLLAKLAKNGFDVKKVAKSIISKEERKKRDKLANRSSQGSTQTERKKKAVPIWEAI